MKAPDKQELIKGIAEQLKAHEEPYEQGSWENFMAQQETKKRPGYAWIGYAAALFMLLGLAALFFPGADKIPQDMVKTKLPGLDELPVIPHAQETGVEGRTQPFAVVSRSAGKGLKPASSRLTMYSAKPQVERLLIPQEEAYAPVDSSVHQTAKARNTPVPSLDKKADLLKFLESESTRTVATPQTSASKWDFGVEVAPTLLDSKLSMGAGITTAYRLSKRFSISTGIAYVALDAEEKVNSQPVSLMSAKKLEGIDASIRAIDIPLSLTYHLNTRLYTSVGVSYFNVLSEQRSNNYATEMELSRTMANPTTGVMETLKTTLVEQNREPAAEQPLNGNSYLGFFNFSVGHVQPIYKNHKIIVEPFVKIPLGQLSHDELKLSNGGVKLRYSF